MTILHFLIPSKNIIIAYEKKGNSKILINHFSKNQKEKIKKDLLISINDTNILATLCFSKLAKRNTQIDQSSKKIAKSKNIVDSRFKKIC